MDPPQVELAGVRVLEMSPGKQTLALKLRVHNPNMLDIPLHSLRYQLDLNGEPLVRGDRQQPITLPGGKDQIVEVKAIVSVQQIILQVQQMAAQGEFGIDYRLHGELRVGNGSVPMPYEQRGRIDLHDLLPFDRKPPAQPKPQYI
jgi:LEA14-like dessication related protein